MQISTIYCFGTVMVHRWVRRQKQGAGLWNMIYFLAHARVLPKAPGRYCSDAGAPCLSVLIQHGLTETSGRFKMACDVAPSPNLRYTAQ